jgi:hypothetical protein
MDHIFSGTDSFFQYRYLNQSTASTCTQMIYPSTFLFAMAAQKYIWLMTYPYNQLIPLLRVANSNIRQL